MKLPDRTWLACKSRVRGTTLRVMPVACLLALGHVAVAQNVVAPPPSSSPVTPPAVQQIQAEDQGVLQPTEENPLLPQETEPLSWGPLTLQPHLFYRFLYATGIQSTPSNAVDTAIHQISPGLFLSIGAHWTADYTATWTLYSSKDFRDSLDHAATLTGLTTNQDWILGVSQSYVSSSAPIVQTAEQTRQADYSTTLSATYQFNPQMALDLTANQDLQFAEHLAETHEWSTLDWLNYQFWPSFTAGAGFGLGYFDVLGGVNSMYEQGQGRIQWKPTQKISVQVQGGVEDLQFVDVDTPDLVTPVFSALMKYSPEDATTFSVGASRTVNATVFKDQLSENMDFHGSVSQRFLKKLYLTANADYNEERYVAANSITPSGRADDYLSLGVRLSGTILKRIKIAAVYQHSEDTSNQAGFSFSSNQYGVEVSCRY
jgi:hypothetical protein